MSLYNAVFGVNEAAPLLLQILAIRADDVPRIRNVYYDGEHIVIYTRTGGGNREYYAIKNDDNPDGPWNSNITASPFYVRDEDDDFDSTYASFYFSIPPEFADVLKMMPAETETPSQQWKDLFETLKKDSNAKPE